MSLPLTVNEEDKWHQQSYLHQMSENIVEKYKYTSWAPRLNHLHQSATKFASKLLWRFLYKWNITESDFPTVRWGWTFTTPFCYEKTGKLPKMSLLHHKWCKSDEKKPLALKNGLAVLLKVKSIECLALLHHMLGGTLRKSTEMNVVTANVTRFIVREEIRAQRHRECIHLLRRCTRGFAYPFTCSVFSLTSQIIALVTEKKISNVL